MPQSSGPTFLKLLVPQPARRWLRERRLLVRPPLLFGRFGGPWRVNPVSRSFGFDRGTPVDRYYIEQFLARHREDIRGRVLEVGDRLYADRFGAPSAVDSVDIVDVDQSNERATMILDLGAYEPGPHDARFDCIICTQTLLLVYDVRVAMRALHGLLAAGGVLLLTVPGISQICRDDGARWEDYWRFTRHSVRRLLHAEFSAESVAVESFGNVLTAASFLYGLASQELRQAELDHRDTDYEVVIAGRAVKGT